MTTEALKRGSTPVYNSEVQTSLASNAAKRTEILCSPRVPSGALRRTQHKEHFSLLLPL